MVRNALEGKRFGRLVVLSYAGRDKGNNAKWLCKCDCGNEKVILGVHLQNGTTRSCTCLRKELKSNWNITHGQSRKTTYRIWDKMRRRCSDPKDPGWKHYGAKGIKVCKKWQKFTGFFEDMGERPPNMTLDRIDSSGDYEKKNCRWATITTNLRNRPGFVKLSMEKAREIRKVCKTIKNNAEIGRMFGYGREQIRRIRTNQTWKEGKT